MFTCQKQTIDGGGARDAGTYVSPEQTNDSERPVKRGNRQMRAEELDWMKKQNKSQKDS